MTRKYVRSSFAIFLALSCLLGAHSALAAPGSDPPAAAPEAPRTENAPPAEELSRALDLTDAPEPFTPAQPRSEEQSDRVEALSLFAAGRVAEQEDRLLEALRRYERAARFDPTSQTALRHAVVLAIRLDRWDEALRYAARGELHWPDAGLPGALAAQFDEHKQFAEALRYYRAAQAFHPDKRSTAYMLLAFRIGNAAYRGGNFAEAADAFATVSAALEHPDQDGGFDERLYNRFLTGTEGTANRAQIHLLFAEAFVAAERFDEAEAALEKSNEIAPDPPVHAYRLARLADRRKEPSKALELLQTYFDARQASEGLQPYQLLVKLLTDIERGGDILPTLEKLHAGDPDNAALMLFLAERYREAGDGTTAEPLYRQLVDTAPSPPAYQGLAAVLLARKDGEALLELLTQLSAKTGNLAALGDGLHAIASAGELTRAITGLARQRYQADPDSLDFSARRAVALLAIEAGKTDDAAEFFQRAIKVNQQHAAELYRAWALGLFARQRFVESAAILQRAIDERAVPAGDPNFHYIMSRVLAAGDKLDEAVEAARHAASLAPQAPQVAVWVAQLLSLAKRYDEAASAANDVLRRFDENTSDVARQEVRHARLLLSNIAVMKDDSPAAEEYLAQILDEFPEDIGAQNDLGYLWADESKHLKRSLAMIERAVAAEPENAAYRDSLGWIFYRLGRYDEAVAELIKAVAGEHPDGVVLEHLGDAYQAAGKADSAAETWRKAQAAFEKLGDATKIARVKKKLGQSW